MHLTTIILGSLLLGQVPGTTPVSPAADPKPPVVLPPIAEPDPAAAREGVAPEKKSPAVLPPIAEPDPAAVREGAAPEKKSPAVLPPIALPGSDATADGTASQATPARSRLTPPQMVAEALQLPPEGKLTGRPLTLLAAISSTADRQQQLRVATAYWRLVEAVARYRFASDYDNRLSQFPDRAEAAVRLRAARASSAAMLEEAELAAVAAQHELAALVLLPPEAPLPLPADPPHVGPYLTRFDDLFASRAPPARARLIDRTLPIRRRAIESHAAAVLAAEAAEGAVIGARKEDWGDVSAVLAAARACLRQRQAFITSVCRYNEEIADYVLAVVGPGTHGPALLRMLITSSEDTAKPLTTQRDQAVRPAGHDQPVPTPAKRPDKNVPTPARRPAVPDSPSSQAPMPRTANKPVAEGRPPLETPPTSKPPLPFEEGQGGGIDRAAAGLYAALADAQHRGLHRPVPAEARGPTPPAGRVLAGAASGGGDSRPG